MHSHILSIKDFANQELVMEILSSAREMIQWADKRTYQAKFPEKKGVLAFFEPSTRTHKSFKQALLNLGLRIDELSGAEGTSLMKMESMADTARMLAGQGADIIVLRTPLEGAPRWIAKVIQWDGMETRIINGGDGSNQHPTQTLLDLLTIWTKLDRLNNFTIGMVGDLMHGRTTHSLIQALRLFSGIKVVLVSPKSTQMPEQYKQGVDVICESESLEALADCHIVYVTRFQLERIKDPVLRQEVQGQYIINKRLLDKCNPEIKIMHPLPSVDEIAPDIKHDPRLIAFHQAYLGIPTRMALINRAIMETFVPLETTPPEEDLLIPTPGFSIKESTKRIKHFQPITKGTVIDHISAGCAPEVIRILEKKECLEVGLPRQMVQYVKSRKYGGQKDVLLLNDITIPNSVAAQIQLVFPDCTINEFPGDNTIIKKKLRRPNWITGVYRCPNENCITNHDPEASSSFRINQTQNSIFLVCEYCERTFGREQVIRF